jgi:UDP-glucuronate 4-epimerase
VTAIVTGAAGFIGMHVAEALLDRGEAVVGVDNVNNYYDPQLKEARLARLEGRPSFTFLRADIADREAMQALVARHPDTRHLVHLAAQAGVRHSMVDPYAYVTSNVMGHTCVLEAARRLPRLEHLVYASSSSVYGGNRKLPFSEADPVDTPVSLYAATKRADELISHAYAHLYGLPQTGLRFFTVYGPWGRPDMAYYGFAEAIVEGRPITLYEGGTLKRDFTYITDIVQGVLAVLGHAPGAGRSPQLFNIGNNRSEPVSRLVELLERALGRKAVVRSAPRPIADVEATWADVDAIARVGFRPATTLAEGTARFAEWFLSYRSGA